MKHSLLTVVASSALLVSGALAQAQENSQHEAQPGAAKSEARPVEATGVGSREGFKGEPREGAHAAQMNERNDEGAAARPRAAQGETRGAEPTNAKAENNAPKETSGTKSAQERGQIERTQNKAERQEQRSTEKSGLRSSAHAGTQGQEERTKTGASEERNSTRSGPTEERSAARKGSTEEQNPTRTGSTEGGGNTAGAAKDRGQVRVLGKVPSSSEHATRVSDMLMRTGRRENVDVDVRVGLRIPDSVTITPVPAEVIAVAPEYRGYDYFVESDEIVFVAPESHEIVGAIEYSGHSAEAEDATRFAGARPCPIEN